MGCVSSQTQHEASSREEEEEIQRLKAEKEKVKQDLEEELKEEKKRNYVEEQKILKELWITRKQLEDTKAEMEEMKRNFEQQLRDAMEETRMYVEDQLRDVRRNLHNEVESGVADLCGTHTEEEEMKASIPEENMQLESGSSEQQQGEPEETEDRKLSLDNFQFVRKLGEGGFGIVVLAEGKLPGGPKQLYAIKALKKQGITASEISEIFSEKEALIISAGCPFVTTLYSCFQNKDRLFFVMEYLSEGDLWHQLQKVELFSQEMTQFYTAEIILALQYLHKKGIIHRDLKLENVLVGSDGHCRVADFGLAKLNFFSEERTTSSCGTPLYMAPEMLKSLPYGHAVDWWALGVMVFEMLTGKPPYDCEDNSTGGDGDDEEEEEEEEEEEDDDDKEDEDEEEEEDDKEYEDEEEEEDEKEDEDEEDDEEDEDEKLYNVIMTQEVDFPEDLSLAAMSLVIKLLMKNPAERLGADGSVDTIRKQPFFKGINWQALEEKQVKPPEKEKKPEEDKKRFSNVLKPDDTQGIINQQLFNGFTYIRYG